MRKITLFATLLLAIVATQASLPAAAPQPLADQPYETVWFGLRLIERYLSREREQPPELQLTVAEFEQLATDYTATIADPLLPDKLLLPWRTTLPNSMNSWLVKQYHELGIDQLDVEECDDDECDDEEYDDDELREGATQNISVASLESWKNERLPEDSDKFHVAAPLRVQEFDTEFLSDEEYCNFPAKFSSEEEVSRFFNHQEDPASFFEYGGPCTIIAMVEHALSANDTLFRQALPHWIADQQAYPYRGNHLDQKAHVAHLKLQSGVEEIVLSGLRDSQNYDVPAVGMANVAGEFSAHFSTIGNPKSNKFSYFAVALTPELFNNHDITQQLDGFILPGAKDSYHSAKAGHNPFGWQDLRASNMLEHEPLYQQVITYAIDNGVPLIGTCAGHQHLAMHQNGSIYQLPEPNSNSYKPIRLQPGTLNHFMALTAQQQASALSHCKLPKKTVEGYVEHKYAVSSTGAATRAGEQLADSVNVAAALGSHIVTFQFHPEYNYQPELADAANTRIIDSWVHQLNIYRMMRLKGEAFKYAAAMQKVVDRLSNCANQESDGDQLSGIWYAGQTSQTQFIQTTVASFVVHLFPGMDQDNTVITSSANRVIIHGKDKTTALRLLRPAQGGALVEVRFADGQSAVY